MKSDARVQTDAAHGGSPEIVYWRWTSHLFKLSFMYAIKHVIPIRFNHIKYHHSQNCAHIHTQDKINIAYVCIRIACMWFISGSNSELPEIAWLIYEPPPPPYPGFVIWLGDPKASILGELLLRINVRLQRGCGSDVRGGKVGWWAASRRVGHGAALHCKDRGSGEEV